MPYLKIETNQSAIQSSLHQNTLLLSAEIATMLGKPEDFVMVSIDLQEAMTFAGTTEPCAFVELSSLGLSEQSGSELSEHLFPLLSKTLQVATERIYLQMSDHPRSHWGWNGKTFG